MRHGQELSVISGAWANQLKREDDEAQPRIIGDMRCMDNQLKREDDEAQPRIIGDKVCMGKPAETRRRQGTANNYWR